MSLRRLISVLSVVVFASGSAALAQTKTDKKAPAPAPAPAPAKEPAAPAVPAGSGSGSGSAAGSAVQPIEDAPPGDMEGRDENPDAPKGDDTPAVTTVAPVAKTTGYPIEETQRPITLPENMAEVSIAPHFTSSPYMGGDALHARYGITNKIQLGITYVFGGIYDDPTTVKKTYGFHVGKAAGIDVTVLLTNFLGVRVGVPVYFDPFAASIALGAPLKFTFGDKLAIGGMDDVANIKVHRFAPSLYQEQNNAALAYADSLNTHSNGTLRFSGFVEYQQDPKMALFGRIGLQTDLGQSSDGGAGTTSSTPTATFIRAGVQYSPKKYLDVGGSAGFDDLSTYRSFGLAGIFAVRI